MTMKDVNDGVDDVDVVDDDDDVVCSLCAP